MANELPYFRFTVQAWQNGDISLESYEMKGFFIDVCGYYWIKDCSITLAMLQKKFSNDNMILELIDLGIIKHENKHDKINIDYLNKQYDMLSEKRKRRQVAGSKGGNAKAKVKQKGSYKDKDNNKEKDKDKELSIPKNKFSGFNDIKSLFLEFYKLKTGEDYYWIAKDAAKVKPLVSKIKFKIKEKSGAEKEITDEEIVKGFKHILTITTDAWILSNLSMAIIDSKFNDIIANNGKQTTKNGNGNRSELEELSRQLKARHN